MLELYKKKNQLCILQMQTTVKHAKGFSKVKYDLQLQTDRLGESMPWAVTDMSGTRWDPGPGVPANGSFAATFFSHYLITNSDENIRK